MAKQIILVTNNDYENAELAGNVFRSIPITHIVDQVTGENIPIKDILHLDTINGLAQEEALKLMSHIPQDFVNEIQTLRDEMSPEESDVDIDPDYIDELNRALTGILFEVYILDGLTHQGCYSYYFPLVITRGVFSPALDTYENEGLYLYADLDWGGSLFFGLSVNQLLDGAGVAGKNRVQPGSGSQDWSSHQSQVDLVVQDDYKILVGSIPEFMAVYCGEERETNAYIPYPVGSLSGKPAHFADAEGLADFHNYKELVGYSSEGDPVLEISTTAQYLGMSCDIISEAEAREAFPDYPWPAPTSVGLSATKKNNIRVK